MFQNIATNYIDIWSDPYYVFDGDSYNIPELDDLITAWNHSLDGYDVKAETALVLSAAGEYEESFENPGISHGVFTYYLLETRDKGDIDGDGFVTLFEMYEYISYKIRRNWNEVSGESLWFHPRITGSAVDFILF